MSDLSIDLKGPVAVLTINRPEVNNAVGGTLLRELAEAVVALEADDSVRAVVTAAGPGAWSPGLDLEHLEGKLGPGADADAIIYDGVLHGDHELLSVSRQGRRFQTLGPGRWILDLRTIQKPLIAAISGAVAGGGLGLALLHDFRIAGTSAKFQAGFIRLGVGPDMGASWFLPRIVGWRAAADILLRGRTVSAAQAYDMGLVDELVSDSEVLPTAVELATTLAEFPPLAVRATVRALRASAENSLAAHLALEWDNQRITFATEDARAALRAFRSKERCLYTGQ